MCCTTNANVGQWGEWLAETTQNARASEIAAELGVHRITVQRWMRTTPPCSAILAITRAYEGDLIAGMMAAGHMTEADFQRSIPGGLQRIPAERLREELARRGA